MNVGSIIQNIVRGPSGSYDPVRMLFAAGGLNGIISPVLFQTWAMFQKGADAWDPLAFCTAYGGMLGAIVATGGLAKANWKILAAIGIVLAVAAAIFVIYSRGHSAGEAGQKVKQEQAHTKSVATSREDERTAQNASEAVGKSVAETNDRQREETGAILKGINDELPKPSATPAATVPASVRQRSNDLVNRANRAAEDASTSSGAAKN